MTKPMSPSVTDRTVQTYPNRASEPEHERVVHQALARRLAVLLGSRYAGDLESSAAVVPAGSRYLVPSGTLVGLAEAQRLGLVSDADLFGGVVPHAFIGTKAISHGLLSRTARAPQGWSFAFGEQVRDCVLEGYTAFSPADAHAAGVRLLQQGPLRLKPVRGTAGRGQVRVDGLDALEAALEQIGAPEVERFGLVLEAHLEDVTTISVGQVRVGTSLISYHGTQSLTPDNEGELVYGGSELVVVSGGFDRLLQLDLSAHVRLAVTQAQAYDAAAATCYPDFFASRRNYDIACGEDSRGQRHCGVLEQSWRIGGASSAEVAALEVFARVQGASVVRACSLERYGEQAVPPPGAELLYHGCDAQIGPVSKYVMVEDYGSQ